MAKSCSNCGGSGKAYFLDTEEECQICNGTGIDPDYTPTAEEEEQDALDEFINS